MVLMNSNHFTYIHIISDIIYHVNGIKFNYLFIVHIMHYNSVIEQYFYVQVYLMKHDKNL